MSRDQYRNARRMFRDNGASALRWMSTEGGACMLACRFTYETDPLSLRAWLLDRFGIKGAQADIRHARKGA
jgi:hypothetical protein